LTFYDLDGRETDKNDKTGSDVNGQQNEVSHVPKDEIWKYGEFGAIGQGDNKNFLLSKNGNYQLHGITMGPNEGNWLVKEMYLDENGNELSKDVFIAGPEAFKEVFSENFEAHGVKRDRLAIAELLGTDVNYIGDNWIIHEAAKAWTPENIVSMGGLRFSTRLFNPKKFYKTITNPRNTGKHKKFTSNQRKKILEMNKRANLGLLKDDVDGRILSVPKQAKRGIPADMNQAEVDHIIPKSKGGSNKYVNAQVLSKEMNIKKLNN
jgi:hypothetical protein